MHYHSGKRRNDHCTGNRIGNNHIGYKTDGDAGQLYRQQTLANSTFVTLGSPETTTAGMVTVIMLIILRSRSIWTGTIIKPCPPRVSIYGVIGDIWQRAGEVESQVAHPRFNYRWDILRVYISVRALPYPPLVRCMLERDHTLQCMVSYSTCQPFTLEST